MTPIKISFGFGKFPIPPRGTLKGSVSSATPECFPVTSKQNHLKKKKRRRRRSCNYLTNCEEPESSQRPANFFEHLEVFFSGLSGGTIQASVWNAGTGT